MFISLNSVHFCNAYIYDSPQEEPVLNFTQFIYYWLIMQTVITVYLALVQKEEAKVESHEN